VPAILSPIFGETRLAAQATLVRGVRVPFDANGTDANEHDMGFARMFTGQRLLSIGGHPWGGDISLDQRVARVVGSPETLTLAVLASEVEPFPKPGFEHRRSFSYLGPGLPKSPVVDPYEVFERWFLDGAADLSPEARVRRRMRQLAVDEAHRELVALASRVDSVERRKLEVHLDAVRDLQRSLERTGNGAGGAAGALCGHRPATPRDFGNEDPGALRVHEREVPALVRHMTDLTACALACGLTRVATLQLGFAGAKWRFAWKGVDRDAHTELAHRDTGELGRVDPAVLRDLIAVHRYYAEVVGDLARALDALPGTEGRTLLDETLIVWTSEMGRGDHSLENIPLLFLGGSALRAERLVDVGEQPFQRVATTVLRAFGEAVDGFGDAPRCGPLRGVSLRAG
jgi:hypothetical protein